MHNAPRLALLVLATLLVGCGPKPVTIDQGDPGAKPIIPADAEWVMLFDGTEASYADWTASENTNAFSFADGEIVAHGDRSHLFYIGDVEDHAFTNFVWSAEVMTMPNSNAGMYFHTQFQDEGWPDHGYEVQVNNTYNADPRKTCSLYAVDDVTDQLVPDNEWFTQEVTVVGKRVIVKVNGETCTDYTEPDDPSGRDGVDDTRVIGSGTFALQAHDPGSRVHFRDIKVKVLD